MKNLLNSYLFRVILIPAGVFLSVMFGGGAASGLEIAQYISSNGPVGGYVAICMVALLYGTVVFFCYELARIYRTYDYQGLSKVILGNKAWILYEVCLSVSMFGVLAYTSTVGGTAIAEHFGLPRYAVTGFFLLTVVFLNYQGRKLVEMSQVGTAIALLGCCLLIVISAVSEHGDTIATNLRITDINAGKLFHSVWIYTVVVLSYVPIVLYASRDLRTRQETLIAGFVSGITITLPFFGMHTAFLSKYPEVMEKTIPNAWIAAEVLPPLFGDIFVIVLFLVILQTGVGLLQGFLERLDAWSVRSRQKTLGKKTHGAISALVLISCLALSSMGVFALLGIMYEITFWLFMPVFIVPLFTVGTYKVFKNHNSTTVTIEKEATAYAP